MAWTNIHIQRAFETWFEGSSAPTQFYYAFATSAVTPTIDTSATSQLTLVPAGNGWAGSAALLRDGAAISVSAYGTPTNNVDFIQANLSSLTLSATTGVGIPATGSPLRWLLLCGTPGGAGITEVYDYWDLGGDTTVASGQSFVISNGALRGSGA